MRPHPRLRSAAAPLLAALLLGTLAFAACAPLPLRAGPLTFHPRPAPPAPVKGLPAPAAYKAGTPERALAEFLSAWHAKDTTHMVLLTQQSWRHLNPASAKTLNRLFVHIPLTGARIGGVAQGQFLPDPSATVKNLNMTVLYGTPPALHTRTVVVTLYRELRPYEESAKGTWGVSPDFTMSLPDYD